MLMGIIISGKRTDNALGAREANCWQKGLRFSAQMECLVKPNVLIQIW